MKTYNHLLLSKTQQRGIKQAQATLFKSMKSVIPQRSVKNVNLKYEHAFVNSSNPLGLTPTSKSELEASVKLKSISKLRSRN